MLSQETWILVPALTAKLLCDFGELFFFSGIHFIFCKMTRLSEFYP